MNGEVSESVVNSLKRDLQDDDLETSAKRIKSDSLSLISSEYDDSSDEKEEHVLQSEVLTTSATTTNETNSTVEETENLEVKQTFICEMCANNPAKYTCPKCERKTCCLACVKQHKNLFDCDGIRATRYIPVSSFSDVDLLRDISFLESLNKVCETSKTEAKKDKKELPVRLSLLEGAAKKRNIEVTFMPLGMTRRKQNTSIWDKKKDIIFWRVEWLFPKIGAKFTEAKMEEEKLISDSISTILKENELAFKEYIRQGIENLNIVMKVPNSPVNSPKYWKLEHNKTLKETLKSTSIVEFPTIFVTLPNEEGFDCIEKNTT